MDWQPVMRAALQTWMMIALVLLNAYSFGAGCVERFVNYQSWPMLSRADFAAYHRAQQRPIRIFIVVPLALSLLLQIALCFLKPASLSWPILLGMLLPSIAGAISTALIQIPLHRSLSTSGYSLPLIMTLLRTDWIRRAADLIRMLATIMLVHSLAVF